MAEPRHRLVPAGDLHAFVEGVFAALGLPPEDARIQADYTLAAHLRGFDTHGVEEIGDYARALGGGRINPAPRLRVERVTPWSLRVDGDNGMGHVVSTRTMREVLAMADEVGIGAAVVRNSNQYGAASVYALMALERDCVGVSMSNTYPLMAPWGSRERFLGTNPLAVAVPAGRAAPFVLDMAMSLVARRTVMEWAALGRALPEGWALDDAGRPTTDPKAALTGVLPPIGGSKGSALTFVVDILAGVLSGAGFGDSVVGLDGEPGKSGDCGHFLLAFKVAAFMPLADFKARMDTLADRVRALAPAAGFSEVRMPGARGHRLEAERRATGVPVRDDVAERLVRIGAELGVPFPEGAAAGP